MGFYIWFLSPTNITCKNLQHSHLFATFFSNNIFNCICVWNHRTLYWKIFRWVLWNCHAITFSYIWLACIFFNSIRRSWVAVTAWSLHCLLDALFTTIQHTVIIHIIPVRCALLCLWVVCSSHCMITMMKRPDSDQTMQHLKILSFPSERQTILDKLGQYTSCLYINNFTGISLHWYIALYEPTRL